MLAGEQGGPTPKKFNITAFMAAQPKAAPKPKPLALKKGVDRADNSGVPTAKQAGLKTVAKKIITGKSGAGSGGGSPVGGGGNAGGSTGIALPNGAATNGGGGSGTYADLLKQAQETVSAQMNPQLAEYQQEILDAGKNATQQGNDLTELYRRLGVQQGADTAAGQAANAQAAGDITGRYNNLLSSLQQTFGGATTDTNSELGRLGLQAAGPASTEGISNDQKFITGMAQNDKAFAQTMTESKSQSFDNLLKTIQSQGQLAGTQSIAKVKAAAAQTIADLTSKKGALVATRAGAVDTLYKQLSAARTKAQVDAAQQNFMDQIAAGKLGVSQAQLGIAQQNANSQGDLRTAESMKSASDTAINQFKLKNPNGTLVKNPSGSSSKLSGGTGGLQLLNGLPVSKAIKDLSSSLFSYYTTKYGGTKGWKSMTDGHDVHYNSLPDAVKVALKDAFTMAGG